MNKRKLRDIEKAMQAYLAMLGGDDPERLYAEADRRHAEARGGVLWSLGTETPDEAAVSPGGAGSGQSEKETP